MEDRRRDLYDDAEIDRILLRGGTILGTSRTHPYNHPQGGPERIKERLEEIGAHVKNAATQVSRRLGAA